MWHERASLKGDFIFDEKTIDAAIEALKNEQYDLGETFCVCKGFETDEMSLCESWMVGLHPRRFRSENGYAKHARMNLVSWLVSTDAHTNKIQAILNSGHTLAYISETRAPGVLKKLQNSTYQTHVGNTFKTRYVRVGYDWCTSGVRRLYVAKSRCAFGTRLC